MTQEPLYFAKAAVLVRKPLSEVLNAFIDPEITTKTWFAKSSGKLAVGETISRTWDMFDHTGEIIVESVIPNELIQIQWVENKDALVN